MRAMLLLVPSVAIGAGAALQPVAHQTTAGPASGASARDSAPRITLGPGGLAPPIAAEAWINGSAIARVEPGKVYIVEFWATWCGPCVRNIPHLNGLQKKYPAVTVIGVAASESPPRFGLPDQRLANVQRFVKEKGAGMSYRVAYDSKHGVYDAWMTASGNSTIPKTFLVGGDGRIAWIGHPDDVEAELEKVLARQKRPVESGRMRLRPLP